MIRRLSWLLVPVLAAGCARSVEPRSPQSESSSPPAASAAPDMCAEHGVLEAVCTQCKPQLRAVFQSRGDWCAEHGFPESFCPVCHPERGGRPSADVAVDDAPAQGLRVKLTDAAVAERVGIETTVAGADDGAGEIVATAMIVPDASRSAAVNLRVPGVIRRFRADLGAQVRAGTPLADIESSGAAEDRARLAAARARWEAARAELDRETHLHERGISSAREVQTATQALEEARAEVAASQAAVGIAGSAESEGDTYTLVSPMDGVVTARNFTVGTLVDGNAPVFEILDASVLWAEIEIPERDAGSVAVGHRVHVEIDGLPGRRFDGVIRYVAPLVDPHTRTVKARAPLDNRDGVLRANSYGRVRIVVPGRQAAVVPRSAVQEAKGVQLVFVPVSDAEFETRRVRTAPSTDGFLAVTAGLMPGERVVTTGSFLLKTETLKGSIGAGCCDPATGG